MANKAFLSCRLAEAGRQACSVNTATHDRQEGQQTNRRTDRQLLAAEFVFFDLLCFTVRSDDLKKKSGGKRQLLQLTLQHSSKYKHIIK